MFGRQERESLMPPSPDMEKTQNIPLLGKIGLDHYILSNYPLLDDDIASL